MVLLLDSPVLAEMRLRAPLVKSAMGLCNHTEMMK